MAETSPVFRAIITAVDKATAVMDRIGNRAKKLGGELGNLSNPWGKAAGEIGIFTRASNVAHIAAAKLRNIGAPFEHAREPVHQLTEGIHKLGEKFAHVGEKVAELVPTLGALGGAASLGGIFELTHKVAEFFSELAHSSAMLGISTEAMQKLSYAAKMTDTPLDAMQTGLFRLNRGIAEAAAGKNKDAESLFKHLGIATRDASGHLIDATRILPKLQDAFAKTADPAMRARMAMVLFGRGGKEMLPFLVASQEEMRAWSEQASRLVYPFNERDRQNLEGYKRSWIGMESAVGGFMDEVGAKLAPILTPVIDRFTDWVAANRDWIATDIAGAVDKLAKFVEKIDFTAVAKDAEDWAHKIGDVVDKIGGFKTIIEIVAALMVGRWVASAARMVGTLAEIFVGAGGTSWALGVGLVNSIGAAEAAMAKFNETALKSPIYRVATIALGMYDKATSPDFGVDQKMLDRADPAKVAAAGYTRNDAGKWEHNGSELPGAPTAPPELIPSRYNPFRSDFWGGVYNAFPGGNGGDGGGASDSTSGPLFDQLRTAIGGSRNGKVDVNVMFDNAPPGVTVKATGSGVTSEPQTDVGYAFPGMALTQ